MTYKLPEKFYTWRDKLEDARVIRRQDLVEALTEAKGNITLAASLVKPKSLNRSRVTKLVKDMELNEFAAELRRAAKARKSDQ